jgi:tetratricopeptide (TPR) repeat protein
VKGTTGRDVRRAPASLRVACLGLCAAASLLACAALRPLATSGAADEQAEVIEPLSPPAAATAAYLRGRLFLLEGRTREALTQLEKAAAIEPDSVAIQSGLAQAWRRLGDNARSLEHAEIAFKLDPEDRELRREYIGLLVGSDRYAEASELLEKEVAAGDASFETLSALLSLHAQAGEVKRAEELGRRLVKENPDDSGAYLALGSVLELQRRMDEAEKLYRLGLKKQPDDPRVYDALARIARAKDRPDEEISLLRRELELTPGEPTVLARLAQIYIGRQDWPAAVAVVEELVQYQPENIQAQLQLGSLYLQQGRFDAAIETLEGSALEPSLSVEMRSEVRLRLGAAYLRATRIDDALATFEALAKDPEETPERRAMAQAQLGALYVQQRRPKDAIEALLALSAQPDLTPDMTAHVGYFLGLAYALEGDVERAVERLQAIPEQSESYEEAQLSLMRILEDAERYKEALVALDHVIARSDEIEYQMRRAELLQRAGDLGAAEALIQSLIERHPAQRATLYYELGVIYMNANDEARALRTMERALKLEADNPAVLNFIGYTWADNGERLDEAERMIRRAVARRPEDGMIADSLGWVLYKQGLAHRQAGREEQAQAAFSNAIRELERAQQLLDPDDATIERHLGDVYRTLSRFEEALRAYERALELEPEPDDASEIREQIEALERSLQGSRSGATP